MDHRRPTQGSPRKDFKLCVDRYDCALRDLVRHLAQIAAERDYRDFQNSQKGGFMEGEQKEPSP